jgi:alpha-beta hydrolase superfamily lysophospholipase
MTATSTASSASVSGAAARYVESALPRRLTRGPALHAYESIPDSPRAVVALLHGFAEYGGRYAHVAKAWSELGLATVAVDLRGHGKADGERGFCLHFDEYIDDALELVDLVHRRVPERPAFLYGHSFGGLVATSLVLERPSTWRGLLLTGPNFGIAVKVPAAKRVAGRVASALVPGFGLPSGLHGADLTHDAAIARAYDEDPLVFKKARARWFTETTTAQGRVLERAGALRMPLQLTMGTADRVSDFATAKRFFDAAGSTDKTFDARQGLFHEVLNEPEWPSIARSMADWIFQRAV